MNASKEQLRLLTKSKNDASKVQQEGNQGSIDQNKTFDTEKQTSTKDKKSLKELAYRLEEDIE